MNEEDGYIEISNDNGIDLSALDDADDNVVQTFELSESNVRGRFIRLGSELDDIMSAHDYPQAVSYLVAQMVSLSLLLSSMFKYEGIFTLQTKGDGPVGMLVADVTSDGDIRGCATYDEERLKTMLEKQAVLKLLKDDTHSYIDCLGAGYIAFTVDQGDNPERYQGIVELRGANLASCVLHYFTQSEQILSDIKLSVEQGKDGKWRSGGIMIQKMPESDTQQDATKEEQEDWNRASALMQSVKKEELLGVNLHSNIVLHRLFHEEGIRVYAPHQVQKKCRCDSGRVESILGQMEQKDRDYLVKDGKITMVCDFCSKSYIFDPDDIKPVSPP